jgi:hypothetical protein
VTTQWRVTPEGERQYRGTDGNWYAQSPPSSWQQPPVIRTVAAPNKSGSHTILTVLITVLAVLILGAGGFLAYHELHHSTTNVNSTIPGTSMSITVLRENVQQELTEPKATNGFNISGVGSVTCNPPTTWSPGKTFQCYVYGVHQQQIGVYVGTIEPNQADGTPQWNGAWYP